MNYEYIPNELKSIPNWVCWRAIPDSNSHSGIRKVPINPLTGGQAMSNNPQTWSSFVKQKFIQDFIESLKSQDDFITEFSETLWLKSIDHVTICTDERLIFCFRDGTEVKI